MSALKCCKLQAMIFLEIGNISFGSWAPFLRVIYLINLSGQKCYVNLACHRVQRLFGNYFEPCERNFFQWGGTCSFVRYFSYLFPASEKRAFLLYYATPLLSRYLPSGHHLFLMLLTGGMFKLLSSQFHKTNYMKLIHIWGFLLHKLLSFLVSIIMCSSNIEKPM